MSCEGQAAEPRLTLLAAPIEIAIDTERRCLLARPIEDRGGDLRLAADLATRTG